MATSKGSGGKGTGRNGRDSAGKRLGVKADGGEVIHAGSIIIRQSGGGCKVDTRQTATQQGVQNPKSK